MPCCLLLLTNNNKMEKGEMLDGVCGGVILKQTTADKNLFYE